jgi:transcriptional regulator with XRE-family HTH domain
MNEAETKALIRSRINDLLNTKYITMRNLSRQLGFSDGYMNQIMNNNMMPSLPAIISLCEASNMSLSEFFDESKQYPLEYYQVNEELKKMSAKRLAALYTLIESSNNSDKNS